MKLLYLLIDLFTVIIPFLFSFHPKIKFYKEWKWFIPANILSAAVFIIWDIFFTKTGVWGFNKDYVTGIFFYNLPVEEILFFICVPYACVFTYFCINKFYKLTWQPRPENVFIITLSFLLFTTGVYFYKKIYTSTTFISLSLLMVFIKYILKKNWLIKLLSVYIFLFIPFLIVNGILTGTGLQEPVVWYNNIETLGVRILTIPVEDIFYGLELIVLNVFFYNLFRSTSRVHVAL
jgi:lycopene cyclase domain-containing protein